MKGGLNNEPVKTSRKQPQMNIDKDLPSCTSNFVTILIGTKGSGKTLMNNFNVVKLFL